MASRSHTKLTVELPTQVSSADNSYEIKEGLTFATLRSTDRQHKVQTKIPMRQQFYRPSFESVAQHNKQNRLRFNSPTSRYTQQASQQNWTLVEQNQRLKQKLRVLEDQQTILQKNYELLKQQNQLVKRQQVKKQEQIRRKKEKYKRYKQKSQEYDEIIPKLQQLEKLHDTLIHSNLELKAEEQRLKVVLEEVVDLAQPTEQSFLLTGDADCEKDGEEVYRQIKSLIQKALRM